MKQNRIIALTGGIGSGKSLALKILKDAGYKTFSCDEETKKLYKRPSIINKIRQVFPKAVKGIFFPKVDKKEISRICFKHKDKLMQLQEILTYRSFRNALKRAKRHRFSIIEIPLLFECDLEDKFKHVIVIKRNLNDRIESVKKRSNKTDEEVKEIVDSQVNYDEKDFSSYKVIENNGSIDELKDKILKVIGDFERKSQIKRIK